MLLISGLHPLSPKLVALVAISGLLITSSAGTGAARPASASGDHPSVLTGKRLYEFASRRADPEWLAQLHKNDTDGSWHSRALAFGGFDRNYWVYEPKSREEVAHDVVGTPLLLNIHPWFASGALFAWMNDIARFADRFGVTIIAPDGFDVVDRQFLGSWNAGTSCCPRANWDSVDDAAFLRAVVREVVAEFPIDVKRIYSNGFSNGGFMTYRLMCEHQDLFAAMAVSGNGQPNLRSTADPEGWGNCSLARSVPLLAVVGKLDVLVGDSQRAFDWVRRENRCSERHSVSYRVKSTICNSFTDCAHPNVAHGGGQNVTFCLVGDGGHSWPAYNPTPPNALLNPSNDLDNTIENLRFLLRYSLRTPADDVRLADAQRRRSPDLEELERSIS